VLLATNLRDHTAELRARLNRGIALLSKGRPHEARTVLDSVLADARRRGDQRASAYALLNLGVIAMQRHEYAAALEHWEQTIKLLHALRDRIPRARTLANLAELRARLGLLDHAEHALTFGRRTLGPGMTAGRAAHFARVAARVALARGRTVEARREIEAAIADGEVGGDRDFLGESYRVAARVALEDGDLTRAMQAISKAEPLATKDDARAEMALLGALHDRAAGNLDSKGAFAALSLARSVGDEELLREAHVLVAEMHRNSESEDIARAHIEQAISLRDKVANSLPADVRAAYLARLDVARLSALQAQLAELGRSCAAEGAPPSSNPSTAVSSVTREIIGDDPAIRGLLAAIRKVARSSSTVLVRGESGTGKELVAEALHRASDRAQGPMVTVNCAALVETLLLSELFGHEKGAFTGAFARRRGRFELAEGGTLFLDEIGDISPRTQVALLRVLQERTFERVGGTSAIRANVRIVCATHRDLRSMVERGEFREDLYYRLRGITLEVPPLRARLGDLPRVSEHLLRRIAAERGESLKTLSPDAIELLARHRWPGNVRELENALRAASLFAESSVITGSDLVDNVDDLRAIAQVPGSGRATPIPAAPTPVMDSDVVLSDVDSEVDAPLPAGEANATAVAYAQVRQGAVSLSDIKRQIERDCIARALAETKGNITRAAALLGMKRPRLSQLVKQYGLAAVSSEGLG
jgi:transcriptional regulator with GAF, ATPase, and Fis domain